MNKVSLHRRLAALALFGLFLFARFSTADAQTWQAAGKSAIPVVVEGSACNSLRDTAGISAGRTVILGCLANLWVKTGGGSGGGSGNCGTPAPFAFIPHLNVHQSNYLPPETSNQITLSGTSCPAALSVSGGLYPQCSVNSAAFTTCGGYMAPGDTLVVRQLLSTQQGVQTNLTVTIAGVSAVFTVSTYAYFWQAWSQSLECYTINDVIYMPGGNNMHYETPGTPCPNGGVYAWYAVRNPAYDSYCIAADTEGAGTSAALVRNVQYCQ